MSVYPPAPVAFPVWLGPFWLKWPAPVACPVWWGVSFLPPRGIARVALPSCVEWLGSRGMPGGCGVYYNFAAVIFGHAGLRRQHEFLEEGRVALPKILDLLNSLRCRAVLNSDACKDLINSHSLRDVIVIYVFFLQWNQLAFFRPADYSVIIFGFALFARGGISKCRKSKAQ